MKLWTVTPLENSGKYRQWFWIMAMAVLFSANKLHGQGGGPCSGITFEFEHYEPCKFRAKYANNTDCFTEIRYILQSGQFSSWNVNSAAGFTVEVISPSELWVHHTQGFLPLGNQVPLLFTLPPDLNTTMGIAYLDNCAQLGCELIGGVPIESCPDPKDASIGGVKYRECGSLPYSNQPTIPGWTIQAFDTDGNLAGEAVTDADGNYRIYDLPLGVYWVRELPAPGWTPKVPASGEYLVDLGISEQATRNFGNCPDYLPNVTFDGVVFTSVSNSGFLLSGDSVLVAQTGSNCFDIHLDLGSTDAFDAWYNYKNQVGSKLDWKVNGTVAGIPNQLVGMGIIEQISDSVQTFQPSIVQASELSVKYYYQGVLITEEVIQNGGKVDYNDLLRIKKFPDIHTDWNPETMTLTLKISFPKGDAAKKQAQSVDLIEVTPIGSAIELSAINSLDLKACNTSNFGFNRSIKLKANGPTTFCEGGAVTIAATTSATANLQWQKNQVDIPGATSTTYVATTSGNYRVKAKVSGNEYFSNGVSVITTPLIQFYQDADGDGFGNSSNIISACVVPMGYVANGNDCNDANASIHPGAPEQCDGLDNNCDGQVDEDYVCYTPNVGFDGVNFSAVSNAGFLLSGDSILVGQTGGNCFDIHLDLGSTDAFDAWYHYKNQVGSKLDWKVNGTIAGGASQLVGMGIIEQISDSVQTFQPSIVQASELSVKYYYQGVLVLEEVIQNGGKVEYNDLLRIKKFPDIHTDWDPETMTFTIKISFPKGDVAKKQAQSVDLIEVTPTGSAIELSAINSLDLKACNTSNFGFNRSIKLKANGPTSFCEGGAVTIAATTSATANLQWQKNQADIPGATSTTYVATTSGNYRVKANANGNEYFSNETEVTAHSTPSVSASITNDHNNTNVGSIDVSILTGMSPFTFEWRKNGQLLPNSSEDLSAIGTGTYTLLLIDANGCSVTETYVVQNTVGINTVLGNMNLHIHPNPTTASFIVTLPAPARPGMRMRITDPAGRIVQELDTQPGADQQTVQAGTLPGGLYLLQVIENNQVIAVEKFVKQ